MNRIGSPTNFRHTVPFVLSILLMGRQVYNSLVLPLCFELLSSLFPIASSTLFLKPSSLLSLVRFYVPSLHPHIRLNLHNFTLHSINMSSSGAGAATPALANGAGNKLRSHLEAHPLTFHVKTGNSKWQCQLLHKNALERQRATRTNTSSSSASGTSSSSASSVGSH
ncbi:hypothetical protein DL546_004093 [Coniochaeta pulveracea]|uniref:Uncharacterized protein n=1 Tax=Coniochaeta pulveracea TaxID=177199 RepID=A0A420YDK2_9PEZI|nr:hypothetical protein DL546_004093 [Coniochaeta pulveracea]